VESQVSKSARPGAPPDFSLATLLRTTRVILAPEMWATRRLLEEQMDEMGLTEEEKDLKVDGLVEHVKKVKSARAESRPK
jgi:hypothetical protein